MPENQSAGQIEQLRLSALESVRVEVPKGAIVKSGKAVDFFDCLENNSDLTEEYLYAHQPVSGRTIPVYSPSIEPVWTSG